MLPADFTDVQITLLLPEYVSALGKGDDSIGHSQVANVAIVCSSWNESCTSWRATVQSLELRVVNTGTLNVVARFYPALQRLKLVADCYYLGCTSFGANLQQKLLQQCSLLAARCQRLELLDAVGAGVELTDVKMDALSLGRVRPGLDFRFQCVANFRVTPPDGASVDYYFKAKTTTPLEKMMEWYCALQRVEREQLYFTYGTGTRRLAGTDTIFSLLNGPMSEHFARNHLQLALVEPIHSWIVGEPQTPGNPTGA